MQMSTAPPDDPRSQETWEQLRKRYVDAVRQWEALRDAQAERLATVSELPSPPATQAATVPSARRSESAIAGWITTALQSVTLVTIVGCAFWLGSLSTTVASTSQKLDKLNDAVVGVSRDSVSNRLVAIETKLELIEKNTQSRTPPSK
jgi:hypothetical protein